MTAVETPVAGVLVEPTEPVPWEDDAGDWFAVPPSDEVCTLWACWFDGGTGQWVVL